MRFSHNFERQLLELASQSARQLGERLSRLQGKAREEAEELERRHQILIENIGKSAKALKEFEENELELFEKKESGQGPQ